MCSPWHAPLTSEVAHHRARYVQDAYRGRGWERYRKMWVWARKRWLKSKDPVRYSKWAEFIAMCETKMRP